MMTLSKIILIITAIVFYSCNQKKSDLTGYILSNIKDTYKLPAELNEISGISYVNNNEIACIQDEEGTIYIYDVNKKIISKEISFEMPGDYEGIAAINDNRFFILRNDGALIEFNQITNDSNAVHIKFLNTNASDNEGLCYDEINNKLLISTKSKIGKEKSDKNLRLIYEYDIDSQTLSETPIVINTIGLTSFAKENSINLPIRKKGKKPVPKLKFRPSAIAIHPISRNIYIISAIDNILLVIDDKGNYVDIEMLDSKVFSKPEGISFFDNGDMFIANENTGNHPTILRINHIQ